MNFNPGLPCLQRYFRIVTPGLKVINRKNRATVLSDLGVFMFFESRVVRFLLISVSMILLLALLGCQTSTSYVPISSRSFNRIDKLLVEVDMAKEIDFLGDRLDRTMLTEMMFGLIGRSAEIAHKYYSDKEVAKQISVGGEIDFVEVLMLHLRENLIGTGKVGSVEVVRMGSSTGFSNEDAAHLRIFIPSWGLRRMRDEGTLKAYLDASLEFNPSPGPSFPIEDQQVISIDTNKSLDEYKSDRESLREDILGLIATSSKRIVSVIMR